MTSPEGQGARGRGAKRRLLDVAYELYSRHGSDCVTVKWLCREAGANSAAVSYHFGSKDGLYVAVVLRALEVLEGAAPEVREWLSGDSSVDLALEVEHAFRVLAREALDRRLPARVDRRVAARLPRDSANRLERLRELFPCGKLAGKIARHTVAGHLEDLLSALSDGRLLGGLDCGLDPSERLDGST